MEKNIPLYTGTFFRPWEKRENREKYSMQKILLLEDDRNLNRGITLTLEKEGYQVFSAFSAAQGERLFEEQQVDLVICDINLPDGSGLDFCQSIRKKSRVYFLFLTALDQEVDIVSGYQAGADDYITKPFSLMVLVSKVRAFLRRASGGEEKELLISGEIRLFPSRMKAFRQEGQQQIPLTLSKKEMQLLLYFMENPGQIISKEQILEHVWGLEGQFVDDNTVPVNISRLKAKLGNPYIENIRGMGYIWTKECRKE